MRMTHEQVASLLQQRLASHGMETTPSVSEEWGVHLRGQDGAIYPVSHLASRLADTPDGSIETVVAEHARRLVTEEPDATDMPKREIRRRIRSRLVPLAQVESAMFDLGYARPFAGDVMEALCIDYPTKVVTVTNATATALGVPLPRLFAWGRKNTLAEPHGPATEPAPGVQLVQGSSLFVSSQAVQIGTISGRSPFGVLFGIPDPHTIVTLRLRNAGSIDAIERFWDVLETLLHDGAAERRLSPHIFIARGAEIEAATEVNGPRIEFRHGGLFEQAVNEIAPHR